MGSKKIEARQTIFTDMAILLRETVNPEDAAGLPYIGLEHIQEGGLHLKGVGKAEDTVSTKFKFRKGDILFGKLRPYFRKVIIAPFDGVCSTDIWVVRAKSGFDQKFLFYCMASQKFVYFASQGSEGTRMPRAKWEHVGRFCLPHFTLPEQKAIAHILGTLDDKIELNRRMNETLEEMAKATFKSWFVDFDPVIDNALKAGNPIPDALAEKAARRRAILEKLEKEDPKLPKLSPKIARLFPDSFEDSPLGPVPKGWRVGKISSICDLFYGKNLPKAKLSTSGYPVYGAAGIVGYIDVKIFNQPQLLITCRGSNSGLLQETEGPCFITNNVIAIVPKYLNIYRHYIKGYLQNSDIKSIITGSAQPQITISSLSMLDILVPQSEILNKFSEQAEKLFLQRIHLIKQSRILASIRDTLLPKLISGQIRIKNVERFVGEIL